MVSDVIDRCSRLWRAVAFFVTLLIFVSHWEGKAIESLRGLDMDAIASTLPPGVSQLALYDLDTGELIGQWGDEEPFTPIGGLHAMMTAWIAARDLDWQATVVVDPAIDRLPEGAVRIGLERGDRVSVRDLIAGTLLVGAQDAALALAIETAGSEDAFVARMNAEAAERGMADTVYTNATGRFDDAQTSTLADQRALCLAVLEREDLCDLLALARTSFDTVDNHLPANVPNRLSLLDLGDGSYDPRVAMSLGIGSNKDALNMACVADCRGSRVLLQCLTSLSKQRSLAAVRSVLDALEAGMATVDVSESVTRLLAGCAEGDVELDVPIEGAIELVLPAWRSFDESDLRYELSDHTGAPTPGKVYATAHICYGDREIARLPAYAAQAGSRTAIDGSDLRRYTQSDESYTPTRYDRYGWLAFVVGGCAVSALIWGLSSWLRRMMRLSAPW